MLETDRKVMILAAAAVLMLASEPPTLSQPQGETGISMTLLPVIKEGRQQFIITPKGYKVAIPGKGIASNAQNVAVYEDAQRNFWYINKHGQPTQVDQQVMQSAYAQIQAQMNAEQLASGSPPQYQPAAPPVQQTTIIQQPASSGGGGGVAGAALGAAGAFAGAVTGAALMNSNNYYRHPYYGVPYGQPIYHGAGGAHNNGNNYYYNNNGTRNYVNVNKNTSNTFKQWNQEGNWNDRSKWSKNLQPSTMPSTQKMGGHAANRQSGGSVAGGHASAGKLGGARAGGAGKLGGSARTAGRGGAGGRGRRR